ncbi:MAG: MBL fold metallo-hydrolase [Balneolaceae bacterium]|nr:MBL fold metallo-hydrolase [Balneolaceae bacterium]
MWNNYGAQAQMFGFNVDPIDVEPEILPITNNWSIGPFSFDVRYTPGHAPDHVVLYSSEDELVIAGDTLFKQGIGRTDLYKGSFSRLEQSIREKLYTLPDETKIYPGHGPDTTVIYEKRNNPFVKAGE